MMNVAARASETILNKVFDVCIWRMASMLVDACSCAFLRNTQLFHEFVKSRSTDAELGSCGSDFARVLLKGLLNHFSFDVLACLSQSRCSRRHHSPIPFQLEVLCSHSRPTGHNHAPFHPVLEFADISRPRITAHRAQRVRRENHLGPAVLAA